jgi:tetratricopeptide (TPR) repeat protein
MRVDGLEGLREAAGRVASEAVLGSVAQAAGEVFGQEALLGRHAPDTLAALLPGSDAQQALALANRLRQGVSQDTQRSISVGVAAHPTEGFGPADALENAHKALVHTGFFGPNTATAFDAVSLNISGDQFFAQGRLSEAVAEYQRALRLAPSDKEVLNSLGVCYAHLGQMDQAAQYFGKAMAAEPSDFMVCYNLGYALMASGNLNQARQRLEEALKLNPDHADTLFQLGRLAQSEGRTADAVDLLSRASRQKDCRPAVHRHLGEALAAVGLHTKAEEAFKRALKVNSADTAALAGLANMYLERGANLEVALSLARRARDLEPTAARHARTLARALEASGQLPEAAEVLRAAIGEHGQDAFLALQLGRVEAARGEKATARDQFLRALALEPNLEAAQEALAQLDQDQKK